MPLFLKLSSQPTLNLTHAYFRHASNRLDSFVLGERRTQEKTLRKHPISMSEQESRRVLSGEGVAPPHPTDAINDSAEKFCLDNRMGKRERAKRAPPHPSGHDKSGPYNTRNKLPHSMQEMQRIGKSYGPSFFWVVVNCPPYRKAMHFLRCIT